MEEVSKNGQQDTSLGAAYLIIGASVPEVIVDEAQQAIRDLGAETPRTYRLGEACRPAEGDLLFLLLDDEEFRKHILDLASTPVRIILLPFEGNPCQQKDFLIPKSLADAVALADETTPTTPQRNLTLCNGEVVLGDVTLGEVEWLRSLPIVKWILYFLRHFLELRLHPFRIETAKGRVVETAALIIPVAHERVRSRLRPHFFSADENFCNRVAALIYAPLSLFAVFRLRMYLYRPGKSYTSLPMGVGAVKSQKLIFRSPEGAIPLYQNGQHRYVDEVVVENTPLIASLILPEEPCVAGGADKESIRVQNIPTDKELIDYYTKRRLPFVPVAPEETFAELFRTLREGARLDAPYLTLLILSVLMATIGLFQNSSPTIIGAMILAPLMAPIISLSMGIMRFDQNLIRRSSITLTTSILLALLTAAFLAWILPFSHQTDQMTMRTHPTLLDLGVALLSGIAAAYGYTNSKVGQSLAGVAIAVALVPPLSVAGIGLGWGDLPIFEGAFLLFLANFAGIILAAGSTFYLLGFTSWRYASSAFVIKFFMMLAIAIPLWLSTETLIKEEKIHRVFDTIRHTRIAGTTVTIYLKQIYQADDNLYAEVLILLPPHFDNSALPSIVKMIRKKVGNDVHLVLSYRYLY